MMELDKGSYDFFATLAEAFTPFRSQHEMPDANCAGCSVIQGTGKDQGKIRFGFMAKNHCVVVIEIVVTDIVADPKEYVGNMLEAVNDGLKQMRAKQSVIFIPSPAGTRTILSSAVSQSIH